MRKLTQISDLDRSQGPKSQNRTAEGPHDTLV